MGAALWSLLVPYGMVQPFPQRHMCHSLTRELGQAQISTAQPFLEEAEPGPDGCLGLIIPAFPGLLCCSCLGFFLLLLSMGLAICHLLPRSPRTPAMAVPSIRLPTSPGCPCCSRGPARAQFLEWGL